MENDDYHVENSTFPFDFTKYYLSSSTSDNGVITLSGNSTNGSSDNSTCDPYDYIVETWLQFDTVQLIRVIFTWILFLFSATGNLFVLFSLHRKRVHHLIIFHLALADLAYTFFVMPLDAVWNTTMSWLGGDFLCRATQLLKLFGMYASSCMVAVISIDRVTTILWPPAVDQHKQRAVILVVVAWVTSALCCAPAAYIFAVVNVPTCEGIFIHQCVDYSREVNLKPYNFFTMCLSFLIPMILTLVSYSLIVCEISNMKERDRVITGRRNSASIQSIKRAKRRTIMMRSLITLTFLVSWGPYYGIGIYDWFRDTTEPRRKLSIVAYSIMYLNSVLHPLVFGLFMKQIRSNFCNFLTFFFDKRKKKHKTAIQRVGRNCGVFCLRLNGRDESAATNSTHLYQNSQTNNSRQDIETKTFLSLNGTPQQCKDEVECTSIIYKKSQYATKV